MGQLCSRPNYQPVSTEGLDHYLQYTAPSVQHAATKTPFIVYRYSLIDAITQNKSTQTDKNGSQKLPRRNSV